MSAKLSCTFLYFLYFLVLSCTFLYYLVLSCTFLYVLVSNNFYKIEFRWSFFANEFIVNWGNLDYLMIIFLLQISLNSDINSEYLFCHASMFVPFRFFINLCSELCGFSQTISIQIIHVSMYHLWRFFTHKLIRIPNFWSMRTRMREDADKDGPSGLTSRMNKIL